MKVFSNTDLNRVSLISQKICDCNNIQNTKYNDKSRDNDHNALKHLPNELIIKTH